MPTMSCPHCKATVDTGDRVGGDDLACPKCFRPMVIPAPAPILDAASAQEAIERARTRVRAAATVAVQCPNCDTQLQVQEELTKAGAEFRCTECGTKIRMASKPGAKGSDSVTFPTVGIDGTLLDMGDVGRKPPEKK